MRRFQSLRRISGIDIMADVSRIVLLLATLSVLCPFAVADDGFASFYTETTPTACFGFDASQFPEDSFWAAASDGQDGAPIDLFQDGEACGKFYKVTCTGLTNRTPGTGCTGKSIRVKVVDRCPHGCGVDLRQFGTQFDLSEAAFQALVSTTDAGIIHISFELDD